MSSNPQRASPALLPGPRLRRALLSISKQAERDIELLSSSSSQARIHALRVRMKKLCALLQLIKLDIAPARMKAIRQDVRALKRAFAMNRDQHVMKALLIEISDDKGACHKERIVHGNSDGSTGLPGPAQLRKLKTTARALTQRLRTMKIRTFAWNDIAKSYAHRYAKARQWFRRCRHKSSAERLHRWRTLVKDHFFQSLILLRHRHHLKATRKLSSLLGKIHDLAMLREHYVRGPSDHLAPGIARLLKDLHARSFRKARQIFVPTPRKIKHQVRAAHRP